MNSIFSITTIEKINRCSIALPKCALALEPVLSISHPPPPEAVSNKPPANTQAAPADLLEGPCPQRSAGASNGNKKVSSAVLQTDRGHQNSSGAQR
jgi:hypothetical protein